MTKLQERVIGAATRNLCISRDVMQKADYEMARMFVRTALASRSLEMLKRLDKTSDTYIRCTNEGKVPLFAYTLLGFRYRRPQKISECDSKQVYLREGEMCEGRKILDDIIRMKEAYGEHFIETAKKSLEVFLEDKADMIWHAIEEAVYTENKAYIVPETDIHKKEIKRIVIYVWLSARVKIWLRLFDLYREMPRITKRATEAGFGRMKYKGHEVILTMSVK